MTSEICLSCIIRRPEHNKIKTDMAESEEAFEGVFEFSVQKIRMLRCLASFFRRINNLEINSSVSCPLR